MAKTFSNLSYKASVVISIIDSGPEEDSGYLISITTSEFPDGREGVYLHDSDQQLVDIESLIDEIINEKTNDEDKLKFAKYLELMSKKIRKNIIKVVKE